MFHPSPVFLLDIIRTYIHNRCTPPGRSFFHHIAEISLAIYQDCKGNLFV